MAKHSTGRKKAAVAIAALVVAFLFLTVPSYHSKKVLMAGNVTLNATDYYEQYYGNYTGEFNEQYFEFRNPADAFNYYCEPSPYLGLQAGVFLDQPGLACYGVKAPLTETGYESYGQAYYACYGFRVAERAGCLYS